MTVSQIEWHKVTYCHLHIDIPQNESVYYELLDTSMRSGGEVVTRARELRLNRGIKASHLAKELTMSRQWFYKIESSDSPRLTPEEWMTWATNLGVSVSELLASFPNIDIQV